MASHTYYVGSYATLPKKAPHLERDFYSGLAVLPNCTGLELAVSLSGDLSMSHANDERWLLGTLAEFGVGRWSYVVTTITATMAGLEDNVHFGLASDDEHGRAAAMLMAERAREAVTRLNAACGAGSCKVVEFHSGPSRHTTDARIAGVNSSAASLAKSLKELLQLDWSGAQLVIEHCDWHGGVDPVKGFLSIEEELSALTDANAAVSPRAGLMSINWARSVLETRDVATAVAHLERSKSCGLLGGLMFSGCSGVDGPYGVWKDTHMPHAPESCVDFAAEGSLLNSEQMRLCLGSARGCEHLAFVGAKLSAKHVGFEDVLGRVGVNRDILVLLAMADAEERCAETRLGSSL